MTIQIYRRPLFFYTLTTAIPWPLWLAAAYLSHITPASEVLATAVSLLLVAGLVAPAAVALCMIWSHADLRNDFKRRLIGLKNAKPMYFVGACVAMPGTLVLAQAISLALGYSADQFTLSGMKSYSAGILPGWFALLLAPFIEELAWHSYGNDSLRQRMNLIKTCLLFAVYWSLWHFPLSFVNAFYHSNVAELGLIYSLNFFLSIFPYVIIVNWLYYKAHRSIAIAILFHLTANLFAELFSTHPDTKIIQTVLLLIVAITVLIKDRNFFFEREYSEELSTGVRVKSLAVAKT